MKQLNFCIKMATVALLLCNGAFVNAQVTVGSLDKPAATLDVVASPTGSPTADGVIVPRLTKEQINARRALYTPAQTGAEVYVTDYSALSISGYSDQIGCVGFAYWDGTHWVTNCGASPTYVRIVVQPQQFTFYELGTETETALTVSATGSSVLSYQWRKITSSNINFRISDSCTVADGAGFNTPSFIPRVAASRNATNTLTASKNGMYRYFVRITNATGETVDSDIAEVAVGCGAKNLQGEWISFMCNNLGADNNTMAVQETTSILLNSNSSVVINTFLRSADERNLYGDLYQWGRIADGHENRNAISEGGTGGDDGNDNCASWNAITPPTYETWNIPGTSPVVQMPINQISRTDDTYYGKFVKTLSANNSNWFVGSVSATDLLWQESANNSNDPCRKVDATGVVPSGNVDAWYPPTSSSPRTSNTGWRLPSQSEWASLFRGGSTAGAPSIAMANTLVWYQISNSVTEGVRGLEFKPDGATTTLFLSANGYRNSSAALLYYTGAAGYYWSGSISGINAFNFVFNSSNVNPANVSSRGFGFAVRCIKN